MSSTLTALPALPVGVLPRMAALAAMAAVSVYVHRRCVGALGANPTDNSVLLHAASSDPEPGAADSSPLVQPLRKPLLLVVLGWGGSTRKQLRRIVDFCTNTLRCPAVSYINPMLQFLAGGLDKQCVSEILDSIAEQVQSNPQLHGFAILLHSNNGAFVWGELKQQLQDPSSPYHHLLPKLRGVIFDSAPAIFFSEGAEGAGKVSAAPPPASSNPLVLLAKGLYAAFRFSFPCVAIVTRKPRYVHPFWTPAITLWVVYFKLAQALRQYRRSGVARAVDVGQTRDILAQQLLHDVPQVPHLFLYSKGDKLLQSSHVESYISHLRTSFPSVSLRTHDFGTTGHVQHFLKAKTVYAQELRGFLEQCTGGGD